MSSRAFIVFVGLAFLPCKLPTAAAHAGHSHAAPREACAERSLDDVCSWDDAEGARYVGTCRSIGGGLTCVRNQPIVHPTPE